MPVTTLFIYLSTVLNYVVHPESGITMLFDNTANNYEQFGEENVVKSSYQHTGTSCSYFAKLTKPS